MSLNQITNDFHNIVINQIPLIDVRAPIEYEKGAFLNSVNLPIMNDEERHMVGICYKENGNEQAVKLGHELVNGGIRQSRINAWVSYIVEHPNAILYCFRGGMRSKLSQQWITQATDKDILRLEGGYKAFRNFLINALELDYQNSTPIVLGGYTGSGKTILLKELDNSIDLEEIANHRGSSFGSFVSPQPSQINFENNLAYKLIKHKHTNYKHLMIEDEGRNIGKCFIPNPIREYFNSGDLVLLNVPIEERVQITLKEYVCHSQLNYILNCGEDVGVEEWAKYIVLSINKIKNRLGLVEYNKIIGLFDNAYEKQLRTGNLNYHESWITLLLTEYYDPMYKYQIKKTDKKIVFEGNYKEVISYFKNLEL